MRRTETEIEQDIDAINDEIAEMSIWDPEYDELTKKRNELLVELYNSIHPVEKEKEVINYANRIV